MIRGDTASDSRMADPADHRGVSLDLGASLSGRDNDRAFGHVFTSRVRAMGIRDRPISPGSPWQNGIAERLIGTLRRECLDHMVIFSEMQLRRILSAYAAYYNQTRTHLAYRKMHRYNGPSNALVESPLFPIWPGYVTNTSGYDFRKHNHLIRATTCVGPIHLTAFIRFKQFAFSKILHFLDGLKIGLKGRTTFKR